jgi:hypothetical protein
MAVQTVALVYVVKEGRSSRLAMADLDSFLGAPYWRETVDGRMRLICGCCRLLVLGKRGARDGEIVLGRGFGSETCMAHL